MAKRRGRALIGLIATLSCVGAGASPAYASISSVFAGQTVSGNAIPCVAQSDGVRVCHGTYNNGPGGSDIRLKTFDGTPLAVYVELQNRPDSAVVLSLLLLAISLVVLVVLRDRWLGGA